MHSQLIRNGRCSSVKGTCWYIVHSFVSIVQPASCRSVGAIGMVTILKPASSTLLLCRLGAISPDLLRKCPALILQLLSLFEFHALFGDHGDRVLV